MLFPNSNIYVILSLPPHRSLYEVLYLNSNIRVLPVTCVPIMYMPTDETRQDMPFGPGASKDASNVRLEPPLRLDSFVKADYSFLA